MKITQYAVQRRLATSAIVLALSVLGLYGLWGLPVDYLPNIAYPMVKVTIWWRGATPEEIEKNIAEVLEREMATVDRLDSLESSAIEGMYNLDVNFEYGANVDIAYQDAIAAVSRARRHLPTDIEEPVIFKADPSQLPVMQLAVSSHQWDLVELRDWSESWLRDQLVAVPGVAGTNIVGGLEREIRILLDSEALEKLKLPLDRILKSIADENVDQFAGRVTTSRHEIITRTTGEFKNLDEIRQIVVARDGEAKVYLSDIATVEDSHEEARVITRLDKDDCVNIYVMKQADANTVQVANAVQKRLEELRAQVPADIRFSVIENQALYVGSAINGVRNAALQASILLILVVYLFLGSIRQVIVLLLALPLTILFNFGLMRVAGFSLNVFSLGGLVVAIGIVLDNAIVVLESITRRLYEKPEIDPTENAIIGTSEVGSAILASTLTFLALFMPFLFIQGLTSLLFRELILVMAGIVVISLTLAVTLVPMFSATLFSIKKGKQSSSRFDRFFQNFSKKYDTLLSMLLRFRWAILPGFGVILIVAFLLMGQLGGEFLPPIDDGRLSVKVRMPAGTSVGATNQVLQQIEALVEDDPNIASCFSLTGGVVRGLNTFEIANEGQVDIQLIPRAERNISTSAYVAQLRPKANQIDIPGANIMVQQQRIRGIRGLSQSDIQVMIRGQSTETLFELAEHSTQIMEELNIFTNVYVSLDFSKPEYQVDVDRAKAAELGISVAEVADGLRSLISGVVPTRYLDDGNYYDIRVLVPETTIYSRLDVENLPLSTIDGAFLRVRDVANVLQAVGPVEIVREDQIKQVIVQADTTDTSVAQTRSILEARLNELDLPLGYDISFGGQAELMEDMRSAVVGVLFFAIFFAFIVLAVQFNSWKFPGLILSGVPLSLAGVVFMLWLTGLPFGATVIIGILVVIAATVNDGVLLIMFAEEIRLRDDKSPFQAVRDAARIRLRPRLMTTFTTMAGFLPLALNLEEGSDMLQPMAIAAIGGLCMEMLVALFYMPCVYVVAIRKNKV